MERSEDKPRILVAEGNHAISGELRRILEGAAMAVEVASSPESALARVRASAPDVLLCGVGAFDGELLCRKAKGVAASTQVLLVFPPGRDDEYEGRVKASGADGYLVGPLRRGAVVSCVKWLVKIHALSCRTAALEEEVDRALASPSSAAGVAPQLDFEFFKRLLLMEVKRSRRYKYPLSFLMLAVDRYADVASWLQPAELGTLMGKVMAVVVKGMRGMDLCVLYAEDRFLVFLPHTGIAGARHVAQRLRGQLKAAETEPSVTVSVGVASYDGTGDPVSFGGLLKETLACLKKAQLLGGDRVEGAPGILKATRAETREIEIPIDFSDDDSPSGKVG